MYSFDEVRSPPIIGAYFTERLPSKADADQDGMVEAMGKDAKLRDVQWDWVPPTPPHHLKGSYDPAATWAANGFVAWRRRVKAKPNPPG